MTGAHHGGHGPEVAIWKASIESSAPLLGDTGTRLEIVVIDLETDRRSSATSVDAWRPPMLEAGPGSSTARSGGSSGSSNAGWKREGRLTLPADFCTPGAVLIRKSPTQEGAPSVDYIGTIKLVSANRVFHFPAHSWVSSEHGWRVFFEGTAYLPAATPPSLVDERLRELQELQGTPTTRTLERRPADRIYWYQTYDDLSSPGDGGYRPALGADPRRPYPRRLATNRGATPGTPDRELPPAKGDKPWLPYDEQFSFDKAADFNGDTLTAALPAAFAFIAEAGDQRRLTWLNLLPTAVRAVVRNVLRTVFRYAEPPAANFDSFEDVLAFFGEDAAVRGSNTSPTHLYPAGAGAAMKGFGAPQDPNNPAPFKTATGAWDFRLDSAAAAAINDQIAADRVGPVYDSATGAPSNAAATAGVTAYAATAADPSANGARAATISAPPQPGTPSLIGRLGSAVWRRLTNDPSHDINNLLYFPVPRVLDGRPDAWYADEEYGRQALAGFHPTAITALKQLPQEFGSAIRGEHIKAELQGATLEELVAAAAGGAKPRLYLIDHWDLSAYWAEAEAEAEAARKAGKKPTSAVQHAGRCLFYLRKDEATGEDSALVPIAIELAHPGTHKGGSNGAAAAPLPPTAGVVYSRSELVASPKTLAVWRLAKAVFRSLDSSIHQLVAHFNRTHSTLEPFLIAMRRQMSIMHPVAKLMLPHFRYTLNINRNARASLINAGGIIEKTFSAGAFAMRLASAVYGKSWTFKGQALPEDLRERGMLDSAGKPWLDYPFAIDGLDTWAALTSYFEEYISLYYKDDEAVEKDVELQAWWTEVKTEGHGDLVAFGLKTEQQVWGFTGPIAKRGDLVNVLATIAWLASGHHAAVNFGQYDFTSLILNASSLVRRPMPAPGEPAYKKLTDAALGPPQEKVFMTYLADPFSAVQVLATVKLLSAHARDEHTLDEANDYLVDPAACAANRSFIDAMKQLEAAIETRNANPANWARYGLAAGTAAPLPYTLLMASSPPGVTMRGVPYSVSI
ncbi:hypothetical protein HYH02_002791 [Chlamydomonas schloesseri]|uniref:Lipoxygenase n=1 Tax=Chlamydomonas schloesseri TaxID=2026947 RepID=A0A835WSG3_9CHLO|nr:hypothetical protein HYH02_002791 [Chlamydomonas schloesseri]|eukprot:KAG2452554.1 hypothetical protein HYH02_002791 [Chlamydomonas schloesseri]